MELLARVEALLHRTKPVERVCTLGNTNAYFDQRTVTVDGVGYNAVIVPVYLLAFNFILDFKAFYAKKLLVILSVELVCVLIHMAYIQFDFSPTLLLIWSFMFGTTVAITAIGGIVLCLISKKLRNVKETAA